MKKVHLKLYYELYKEQAILLEQYNLPVMYISPLCQAPTYIKWSITGATFQKMIVRRDAEGKLLGAYLLPPS